MSTTAEIALLEVNFSSAKNWAEGSPFPVVPFLLTQSIDFKTRLAQLSANVIPPTNSKRLLGSFAFNTPLSIEINIFREITAPVNLILIITSFIFSSNSSPTIEGLPILLNFSGGSRTSLGESENLHFQLLTGSSCTLLWIISAVHFKTYNVLKCATDIFHNSVQLLPVFHICMHIYQLRL